MNPAKVLGMALVILSGVATVGLALGMLGLAIYMGYQWLGILGGFLAFWLGGTLSFGIVSLAFLPIRALAVALFAFGDRVPPTSTVSEELTAEIRG